MKTRPVGVTIIAILAILVGVGYFLGGLALFGVGASMLSGLNLGVLAGSVGLTVGVAMLVMAALDITFGVGALMLRPWAWMLGVVLFSISLLVNLYWLLTTPFTFTVLLMTLIAAAILGYMYTGTVRTAFGREHGYYRSHRGGPVVHA